MPIPPLILVTASEHREEPLHRLESAYTRAIRRAGGIPVLTASHPDGIPEMGRLLDRIDGVVFSGGTDIHPRAYGAEPEQGLGEVAPGRDQYEIALARQALERDIPVLGICRGLQILAVAGGGTLHQDLGHLPRSPNLLHRQDAPHAAEWHRITLDPKSRLAAIFACRDGDRTLAVNSFHHQAARRLGRGWKVSARSADRVVEALELPENRFALGVQWHAERMESHGILFSALVEAAQGGPCGRAGAQSA